MPLSSICIDGHYDCMHDVTDIESLMPPELRGLYNPNSDGDILEISNHIGLWPDCGNLVCKLQISSCADHEDIMRLLRKIYRRLASDKEILSGGTDELLSELSVEDNDTQA